ncbi:MAG: DUF362 domain-containing protein [Deltaproteobacteria bacterium]|nr:DUF362 domain-containing protein [Deltaproteobacteria bacterium]
MKFSIKKDNSNQISRRDALKIGAATAIVALSDVANAASVSNVIPLKGGPGHVVKVHMAGMRKGIYPDKDAARMMVERAVTELAGERDIKNAWMQFVKPDDKIGLKINCLGTKMVSSMKEVVFSIAESLVEAGIPKRNIVIFDMYASNMMGGRYDQQPNPEKIRVLAHRDAPYHNKTYKAGPAVARFSEIFMSCDSIINIPPIKDHDLVGVTCCMKNVTFGVVEKPHLNHEVGNEAIAHLWSLEEIRKRVKLNIIDGSTILFDGGPKFNRKAHVPHESIYATTDPVAMDSIARELIELLRAEHGLKSLNDVKRPPEFIELSQKLGLGIADRKRINLQTVEMSAFTGKSA